MDYEELKKLIREELESAVVTNDKPLLSEAPKQRIFSKDLLRKKANQTALSRFRRNQGLPLRYLRSQSNRQGVKVGGQPVGLTPAVEAEPRYNLIPQPRDPEKLAKRLRMTSARLGVWRAGTRPMSNVVLDFLADHAIAKSAVYHEYRSEDVKSLGLIEVQSEVKDKAEFLLRPDLGQRLSTAGRDQILSQCLKNPDVQIVISDGLSGMSLDVNLAELLPRLNKALLAKNYSLGSPVYCKFGRVSLQDRIGELVNAKVCLILIGERPGLGTGDGLSAYLIYRPNSSSTHANRNCISNIHPRGLQFEAAVNSIEFVVTKMMEQQTSGVELELN